MAKQMSDSSGSDIGVREDTAKAYRGIYWALLSIGAFVLILAILFFGGVIGNLTDKSPHSPAVGPSQDNVGR
ncbi:MAG: hypothetical protein ACK4S4_10565 [Pyrinomonadaceae bacterium]